MANEIATKEIEKPLSVVRKETVTNEQLADQLARVEALLVKIDQKLSTPLIN
ncbi:MAG TPA: hypothetical protein PK133_10755 [Ferruginibacter sp.]|nr:hypothetical protein [Ferruginibacter sp.]